MKYQVGDYELDRILVKDKLQYSYYIYFIRALPRYRLMPFLELQIYKNNITQTNILLKFKFIKTNKADYDNRQGYA